MKITTERMKAARKVLVALATERRRLEKKPQATADYWNGDSWGSISGIQDAQNWIDDQLAIYLIRNVWKID